MSGSGKISRRGENAMNFQLPWFVQELAGIDPVLYHTVKETVYKTVLNPDQVIPQDEGIFLFQSVYYENNKQYLLRVAVKLQSDRCLIITAYRTSKIQKYWGED
jgi:hypothetical protein